MTRYDALSAAAGGWTLLLALVFAVLLGWCAIELTRWAMTVIREIRRAHRITDPTRLREVAEARTWIEQWETSRTPEATRARTDALTGRTTR